MCGIVGYIGRQQAVDVLLKSLQRLEYRGYDSAGIAILNSGHLSFRKKEGRLDVLETELKDDAPEANIGIGHTRWATHGRPSDNNSHPHLDCSGKFAMVHNGIIENYQQLKEQLTQKGHSFTSDTDTEVFVHLLEELYDGDMFSTVDRARRMLEGSYAVVVMSEHEPDKLIAVRKDSPLIVGIGQEEYFFASDIPAVLKHTRKIQIIKDEEIAVLSRSGAEIYGEAGSVDREITIVDWDSEAAEKCGYDHFMLKEIHEQPAALRDTIKSRISRQKKMIEIGEVSITPERLREIDHIYIAACGTAFHAGLVGKYAIETFARVPVEAELASEFRYRNPMLTDKSLVIVISQSGETADTLAALRLAQERGARVLAVTNVIGSSVAREADDVIFTWAGPEIAVASTKAYVTQLAAVYLIAGYFAQLLGTVGKGEMERLVDELLSIHEKAEHLLEQEHKIKNLADSIAAHEHCFFIGRSMDYAVSMEGSLKLKEISYIHAEAYAAGELKHGTLALVEKGTPVICLATQAHVYEKSVSNIQEVIARDAYTLAVVFEGDDNVSRIVDDVITIPKTLSCLSPILSVIPLQLLAYYSAVKRGCDVDKPRNLAKSVTVE